ncbi:TPR superfamily protein [Trifolium pratense]|uniref:Uncharacterized protein n=2 Tax=Trifolium pratense TaxID=57577 RepID=A0ACB0I6C2_TRIPR|nr:protein SLOW GREEN 1, chloroplastic-like [Trifolium pratense]PNX77300.1 TPR superfamily protein [Trifolium pratense]CAJ2627592.1 unnamed protein product [Trifolium pratense]
MNSLPKTHHLSFTYHHSSLQTSFSFPSLLSHQFSSSPLLLPSIKASSSSSPKNNNNPFQKPQNAFSQFLRTLNPFYSPLFEPAYVAATLIFFFLFRVHQNPTTVTPSLLPPPPADSSTTATATGNLSIIESDTSIENSNDANALRSLVEENVRARKLKEAIRVVDRLIELEPVDLALILLKSQLHSHNGEHKLAKKGFELTLQQDPLNLVAYRGLLMAISNLEEPMEVFLKKVDEMVKFFEEKKMESEAREFKLLIAQVKVMEEDFSGALKVYEQIVKEEPSDFRPYLCQAVVYTLLRKNDEAEKQFQEYRKLVPENHPYKKYFEDNTKILSKKLEKGGIEASI